MTSRLYRTTRPLGAQVTLIVRRIGVEEVGTPTMVILIALYVAGLILLDGRQTQTRVALFLPGRAHDALNRLLRVMPLSTRALMGALVAWVKRRGEDGYLCIDDCVVEKAFAKKLPWAGWTYSFAKKRKVYGVHIVALLWCTSDGRFRIPWPSACGVPNARVLRTSTGPSSSWHRRCSRRSSARGCAPNTSSSTLTTRLGGSPSW